MRATRPRSSKGRRGGGLEGLLAGRDDHASSPSIDEAAFAASAGWQRLDQPPGRVGQDAAPARMGIVVGAGGVQFDVEHALHAADNLSACPPRSRPTLPRRTNRPGARRRVWVTHGGEVGAANFFFALDEPAQAQRQRRLSRPGRRGSPARGHRKSPRSSATPRA